MTCCIEGDVQYIDLKNIFYLREITSHLLNLNKVFRLEE